MKHEITFDLVSFMYISIESPDLEKSPWLYHSESVHNLYLDRYLNKKYD